MVWVYAEDVYRFVPSYTWDRYAQVFPHMWTASAFKGAHGETLVVPDSKRHLTNNLNWLQLMGEQEPKLSGGFRGIAITGWQRYDHFSVLCELLPAALPSLALPNPCSPPPRVSGAIARAHTVAAGDGRFLSAQASTWPSRPSVSRRRRPMRESAGNDRVLLRQRHAAPRGRKRFSRH